MTFFSRCALLLLWCLALPHSLLAGVDVRRPMQITSPSAVMVDEATNQVRVTLRGQMLLAGDLVFSLRLDPRLKKLSSNAGVSTSATQLGLSASSSLEQSFDAYLPDDGHFGFYVGYTFRPGSPLEEGPPVVNSSRAAIYVTIEDGEISRVELSPDPKHTSTELGGPVVPSGASRTSRASGASGASGESDPVPISVSISGRIVYRITRPAFTNEESSTADRTSTHPVYPIKVFTDWDPSTTDRINTPKSVWNSTPAQHPRRVCERRASGRRWLGRDLPALRFPRRELHGT